MTVVVSFITSGAIGGNASGVGRVRAQERLAVGATTSTAALAGETVLVGNGETGMIAVAFGSAPDAAATAESGTTSAGFPVAAGTLGIPFSPGAGAKVNVKAVP